MAGEEERKPDVVEAPEEKAADSNVAELSRGSQEKSQTQQEREEEHQEKRKRGATPSSADLPALHIGEETIEASRTAAKRDGGQEPVSSDKPGKGGDEPVSSDKPKDNGEAVSADKPKKGAPEAPPRGTSTLDTVYIVGEYAGEDIKRDLEPETVTDTKGKQLNDIARKHLGADATDDEVQKHAREIARLNKIEDPNRPLEGQHLKLPGHTKDGGFVTQDRAGNKRTVWDDGTVRVENKDGTGSVRKWQGEGTGYTEHHWGPKPQDNYEIRKTEDGKYEVAEAGTENFREPTKEEADIRVERAKLKDLADARISEGAFRANFDADMERFEQRSKQLEEVYVKEGMSQEDAAKKAEQEIAKTYQEISRVLEHGGDKPTAEFEREILAQQILHHAADPTSVNQGQHPTCAVASLESRLYTRNPSEIAHMMAEVTTKGEYTTKGRPPVTVRPGADSLTAQGDEATIHPPAGQDRSYASQVAQVTLANIAWEKDNVTKGTPGRMRYEQREESPAGKQPADDGGRVVDYSDPKKPKVRMDGKEPNTHPGVLDRELLAVSNDVTGKSEDPIVIENSNVTKPGKDFVGVGSEEELKKSLEDAKKNGKMPILIHVHTQKEPFWTDSNAGQAGGSGGHHMISITDYDAETGKVSVDNQWGESADHFGKNGVSVSDLYKATTSPYQDLKLEVEANRKSGKIDAVKELELLETDKKDGDIKGKDFEDKFVNTVLESERRWQETQDKGPVTAEDQKKQEETVAKMMEIINSLPPAEKQRVLKRLDKELDAQKKAKTTK